MIKRQRNSMEMPEHWCKMLLEILLRQEVCSATPEVPELSSQADSSYRFLLPPKWSSGAREGAEQGSGNCYKVGFNRSRSTPRLWFCMAKETRTHSQCQKVYNLLWFQTYLESISSDLDGKYTSICQFLLIVKSLVSSSWPRKCQE